MTETGGGFTWAINSHENRLTSWSNDAVSDPSSDAIYIRDEDSGTTWTATPLPIREAATYIVRHGQGYSVFEHASHGISQELLLFAPLDAPVAQFLRYVLGSEGQKDIAASGSYLRLPAQTAGEQLEKLR